MTTETINPATGLDAETEAALDALHAADKEQGGAGAEGDADTGIEIELDGAGGEPDVVVVEPEPKKPEPSEEINSALADLRARLEAAERDKGNEARARAEAEARAQASAAETHRANLGLIDNALSLRKQALDGAKARLVEAKRAQDYESEADIQDEMIRLHAEATQLETAKNQYKNAPPVQQQPQRNSDPVEQMASDIARAGSPRSAEWIRAHPEYARDQRLLQKMLAAHNLAEADGIRADTDEYFAAVEATLGIRKTPAAPAAPAPTPRAAPPPSAPAAPSAAANTGKQNPNRITLSRAEVEIANEMGITPQEYARNKIALQKEGKLGK